MKAWKRSLALLLTAAMVLTMGVMAFAAEEAGNGEASPLGDMTGKIVILHTNDTHGHDENEHRVNRAIELLILARAKPCHEQTELQ